MSFQGLFTGFVVVLGCTVLTNHVQATVTNLDCYPVLVKLEDNRMVDGQSVGQFIMVQPQQRLEQASDGIASRGRVIKNRDFTDVTVQRGGDVTVSWLGITLFTSQHPSWWQQMPRVFAGKILPPIKAKQAHDPTWQLLFDEASRQPTGACSPPDHS